MVRLHMFQCNVCIQDCANTIYQEWTICPLPLSLSLSLSAPSLQARLWAAPSREKRCAVEEDLTSSPTALGVQETIAESMYIGRPLVHCILPTLGLCQRH